MQYPTLKNFAGNYIRIGVSGPPNQPGSCQNSLSFPKTCHINSIMRGNGQTYAVGNGAQGLGALYTTSASFAPLDYTSQGFVLPRAANPNCMRQYNQWFAGGFLIMN